MTSERSVLAIDVRDTAVLNLLRIEQQGLLPRAATARKRKRESERPTYALEAHLVDGVVIAEVLAELYVLPHCQRTSTALLARAQTRAPASTARPRVRVPSYLRIVASAAVAARTLTTAAVPPPLKRKTQILHLQP